MRVLAAHNFYQADGGEDVVFKNESSLLESRGHTVITYMDHNDRIREMGALTLGATTIWNRRTVASLRSLIERERPEIAHFHNTFPLISPSAYYACKRAGVPVVQTLHNYRLLCPTATLFRDGSPCEECLDRSLWRGVKHGCYRDSRSATAGVAAMLSFHRFRNTWRDGVECFIALTHFSKNKFVQAGFPEKKIEVKPNFVNPDPGCRTQSGGYALFVGRLSQEKGASTLLSAWRNLASQVPLRIVGEGPLRSNLEQLARQHRLSCVRFEGRLSHEDSILAIKGASFLIFPSRCWETFGMVAIEAFACGTPVIASRLGAAAEIVRDGHTGLHFTPGDAQDLAVKVEWAIEHTREMEQMGRNARSEYETKYTAERNYEMLMQIYHNAINSHQGQQIPRHAVDPLVVGS